MNPGNLKSSHRRVWIGHPNDPLYAVYSQELDGLSKDHRIETLYSRGLISETWCERLLELDEKSVQGYLLYLNRIDMAEALLRESKLFPSTPIHWAIFDPDPTLRNVWISPWLPACLNERVLHSHRHRAWEHSIDPSMPLEAPRDDGTYPTLMTAVRYHYQRAPLWAKNFIDLGFWLMPHSFHPIPTWNPCMSLRAGIRPAPDCFPPDLTANPPVDPTPQDRQGRIPTT